MTTSIHVKDQKKTFSKALPDGSCILAHVRWDDSCGNGYNTLAVTGDGWETVERRRQRPQDADECGCSHDRIVQAFPKLTEATLFHLCSPDGPMHYGSNTTYLAGDIDYNGMRKGERRQLRNGKTGLPCWRFVLDAPAPNIDAEECPPPVSGHYEPWWIEGVGKDRDLAAARSVACWPEATDEQLCLPKEELTKLLEERLPAMLVRLKACVESLGFVW